MKWHCRGKDGEERTANSDAIASIVNAGERFRSCLAHMQRFLLIAQCVGSGLLNLADDIRCAVLHFVEHQSRSTGHPQRRPGDGGFAVGNIDPIALRLNPQRRDDGGRGDPGVRRLGSNNSLRSNSDNRCKLAPDVSHQIRSTMSRETSSKKVGNFIKPLEIFLG